MRVTGRLCSRHSPGDPLFPERCAALARGAHAKGAGGAMQLTATAVSEPEVPQSSAASAIVERALRALEANHGPAAPDDLEALGRWLVQWRDVLFASAPMML